jgi:hypothetical protein
MKKYKSHTPQTLGRSSGIKITVLNSLDKSIGRGSTTYHSQSFLQCLHPSLKFIHLLLNGQVLRFLPGLFFGQASGLPERN